MEGVGSVIDDASLGVERGAEAAAGSHHPCCECSKVAAVERKTKIIATIGPATGDRETIGKLVAAGMDVARLNFSHGDPETHRHWARWVHEAAEEQGRAVAVLQDIQGPRIRVGTFPGGSDRSRRGHDGRHSSTVSVTGTAIGCMSAISSDARSPWGARWCWPTV